MAKLIFRKFRCDIDTDEIGGDSPYFVTWVGNLVSAQSVVKFTRQAFWENNVDMGDDKPGPWWPVNHTIVNGFDLSPAHALVLTAMVEEDEAQDLSQSEAESLGNVGKDAQGFSIPSIQKTMSQVMETHRQAGFNVGDAQFISTMRNTLEAAIRKRLNSPSGAQDDLMEEGSHRAARKLTLGGTGDLSTVVFKGSGGKYEAIFRVE